METTYKLKPNLIWHDGTALSAEDFAFAHRIYATPDFGQSTTPPIGQMEEVVAPDARTVVILTRTIVSPRVDYYAEIERVIEKYAYDARQAQQLMEGAGFAKGPDGFFVGSDGKPVQFSVASSAGERQEIEVAVYVDSLRRAGFDVSQRVVSVQKIRTRGIGL